MKNNVFSKNIKLLRKRRKLTQDEIAFSLKIKRSTLSGYENNVALPGIDTLITFSTYFNIAIDTLVKIDLSKISDRELSQVENGYDVYIKGSKLRILATTVNNNNEENIELVNEKAKAGYKNGFADPDYIKVLPTFNLPFLSKQKKYRTFQISGDSMLPIPDGAFVTAEFVQDWNFVKSKQAYIILTIEDGIVFKIVENLIKEEKKLKLHSLNTFYKPYDILIKDIKEIWKFVNYINTEMPKTNHERENILHSVNEIKKDIKAIQTKLDL
ncbi:MAG: helix-turn-helix domain-containing protein [Bacteroidota bacterium]|nr:helix-turn-helix domain-containing protein [Bacteroidota bacterium]